MGPATPQGLGPKVVLPNRLDSWKAIATYLERDVRTVQRWERLQALPVHRIPGGPKAGVYAFRSELDIWLDTENAGVAAAPDRHHFWRYTVAAAVLLLAVGAGFLIAAWRNPASLILGNTRFTPFAISLQVQVCPAWSPDGRSIAFTTKADGQPRLMVQSFESSTPIPVTGPGVTILGGGDPVWCRKPLWSPDSQWLYFLGTSKGVYGLHRVSIGGNGEPILVQPRTVAATLSPDGKTLITFGRQEDKNFRIWMSSPPEAPRKLYPAPVDAPSFGNVPELAFSPDGNQIIAILTLAGANQYWLLPWPPAEPKRIFEGAEQAVGLPSVAWMPDSHHLVFAARGILAMANFRTGHYWPIAAQDRGMHSPTPSPDGTRIAYQSMLSHSDVIAIPLDGGPIQTLLGTSAWEQMPSASPVGPQVVYTTEVNKHQQVWIKNYSDGTARPLVSGVKLEIGGRPVQLIFTPVFSPDGARIAFAARSPRGRALFTMQVANGLPALASTDAGVDGLAPTWSPDGAWLAFRTSVAEKFRLKKVRVGSADPPIDLGESCGQTMPEWSPTGEWIAYPNERCQFSLISPDGKQKVFIGGTGPVAWSRDGRTLYRVDPDKHALAAVEIPSRRERVLRDLGELLPYSGPQPGLRASLTYDGKSIVYSVLRPREEIWILEDVRIREPWSAWLLSLVKR